MTDRQILLRAAELIRSHNSKVYIYKDQLLAAGICEGIAFHVDDEPLKKTEPPCRKWEYRYFNTDNLIVTMNEIGKSGWEVVHVDQKTSNGPGWACIYAKREP